MRMAVLVMMLIAVNLPFGSLSAQGTKADFREVHLGMEVRVVLSATDDTPFAADGADGARAARLAFDRIATLEAVLSDWRATSELRRLEMVGAGHWTAVSAELMSVLSLALDVARATNGRFDPTIGPLTRLWREAARTGSDISDSDRTAARQRVDFRALEIDSTRLRVRLHKDSIAFDLGALAKGFIIDQALATLRDAGVPAALIEAGGDLAVYSAPIGTTGWQVRVPRSTGDTVLILTSGAVSTSGDEAQHVRRANGTIESHVMQVPSGYGASDGRMITVSGASAAVTDALATALTLVSPHEVDALAAKFEVRIVNRGVRPEK